jgi:DNA replication protein DnaC
VTCRGNGLFNWWDDEGQGTEIVEYKCPCEEQFLLNRWLLNSGVDLRHQRQSWRDATGVGSAVFTKLYDYTDNVDQYVGAGIGLMMHGMNGTGKTMMANLVLKRLLLDGRDCFFTTFGDLLDSFTAGWRNEDDKVWFETRIRHAGILVIDDIGKEHTGRHQVAESTFDLVLRARVGADRPTLVTTNYTPEEVRQNYAISALSLLRECSLFVEFAGIDYREELARQRIDEALRGITRPVVLA